MEFGGVGKPGWEVMVGGDLAATAAKLSLPVQKEWLEGFGMSTEAVIPFKAMPMLEMLVLLLIAIVWIARIDCFSVRHDESDHFSGHKEKAL